MAEESVTTGPRTPPPASSPRRRWPWWARVLVAVIVVALLVPVVLYAWLAWAFRSRSTATPAEKTIVAEATSQLRATFPEADVAGKVSYRDWKSANHAASIIVSELPAGDTRNPAEACAATVPRLREHGFIVDACWAKVGYEREPVAVAHFYRYVKTGTVEGTLEFSPEWRPSTPTSTDASDLVMTPPPTPTSEPTLADRPLRGSAWARVPSDSRQLDPSELTFCDPRRSTCDPDWGRPVPGTY